MDRNERVEYLFEAETRPMLSLEPETLDKLQEHASVIQDIHDPVFGLDEVRGSISATFTVDDVSAPAAASQGSALFVGLLFAIGITHRADCLDSVCSTLYSLVQAIT